jgi:hypothetical protein
MNLFRYYYLFLKKISNWKNWVVSLVIFLISYFLINGDAFGSGYIRQITGGVDILDAYFYYPPQKVYEVLGLLGEAGRHAYLTLNLLDFFYPIIYTAFFCISMSLTYTFIYPAESKRNWLLLLPLVTLLADYAENICIRTMLLNYPTQMQGFPLAATMLTPLKTTLLVVVLLLILQGNIKVTNKLFSKKKPK